MTATLPYHAYVRQEILDAERKQVFTPSWQYVGTTHLFEDGVRSLPASINGISVILTWEDEMRALVNVCAHRGSLVCKQPSSKKSITCPYHAWRYDLEGRLVKAPRSEREVGFDISSFALEQLPTSSWGPFVFVATTPEPMEFAEFLGDLPDEVKAAGVDVEDLTFHHRAESELAANWKIVAENFLECYHCRVAHPDFSRTIDTSPDNYLLTTSSTYSTQRGPVRDNRGAIDTAGEVERSQFHLLYPNTAINIMPGRPNLSIGPINPVSPDRTSRFLDYFFGADVKESWISEMVAFDDQVGREDVVLVEDMQKGVAARPDRTGTLLMDSEKLIHHFESHLRDLVDYS